MSVFRGVSGDGVHRRGELVRWSDLGAGFSDGFPVRKGPGRGRGTAGGRMVGDGAAERLWDEFRGLYVAAGSPTLASLVALGLQQRPPAQVADATLSGWLNRQNVPGLQSTRVFLALVAVLQGRAKTRGGYQPRPEGWWQQLLRDAQDERTAGQKTGRPRRQDGPAPAPGGRVGPGVRVADADLRRLGVHAAISVPGVRDEVPPEYVPRDVDAAEFGVRAKVAAAAQRGGFVLLTGGSSVGKTRCAAEAVRTLLPDWRLVHPAGPGEVAALAAAPSARTVLWLDELQRYLDGEDGLSGGMVRALLSPPDPMVIIGTLWPDRYAAYTTVPIPGNPDPRARERQVLELADIVRIGEAFSAVEQERARAAATRDPRLKAALESDGYGLTQTLAAAPQLVTRWEDSQTAAPYAWAVLTAALDAARLGARTPLTAGFLRDAAPGYSTSRQQAAAPADWFEQALAYATGTLHGAASALAPAGDGMGRVAGYTPADYLVQHANRKRHAECVPPSIWDAFLSHIRDPADAARLGESAENRLLYRYAIPLYREAGEVDDGRGARRLARLLIRRGDVGEAMQILRARADAGDREATIRLARLLARHGDMDGLRARADAGDEYAPMWLDALQAGHGDLDGLRVRADAGDQHAAWQLAEVLDEHGDMDGLRARADAGDQHAAMRLAGVLDEHGDMGEAVQILRAVGDALKNADDEKAVATPLDLLRFRADFGDEEAAMRLAGVLAEHGNLNRLRARADAGNEYAAMQLAKVLAQRGDLNGLRARADAGDQQAAWQLAKVLAQRGDLNGLRARADAGDQHAAGRLAGVLAEQGRREEAGRLRRFGLNVDGSIADA